MPKGILPQRRVQKRAPPYLARCDGFVGVDSLGHYLACPSLVSMLRLWSVAPLACRRRYFGAWGACRFARICLACRRRRQQANRYAEAGTGGARRCAWVSMDFCPVDFLFRLCTRHQRIGCIAAGASSAEPGVHVAHWAKALLLVVPARGERRRCGPLSMCRAAQSCMRCRRERERQRK